MIAALSDLISATYVVSSALTHWREVSRPRSGRRLQETLSVAEVGPYLRADAAAGRWRQHFPLRPARGASPSLSSMEEMEAAVSALHQALIDFVAAYRRAAGHIAGLEEGDKIIVQAALAAAYGWELRHPRPAAPKGGLNLPRERSEPEHIDYQTARKLKVHVVMPSR